MRIALSEMSDQELLKNHFESGDEMLKRNMVGAEIWKTADGVITNGSREAREAILNIFTCILIIVLYLINIILVALCFY